MGGKMHVDYAILHLSQTTSERIHRQQMSPYCLTLKLAVLKDKNILEQDSIHHTFFI